MDATTNAPHGDENGAEPERPGDSAGDVGPRDLAALFRAAFEQAPIGMAVVDLHHQFLAVNRARCRLTGHTESELLAVDARTLVHPDDLEAATVGARRLLSGEIQSFQQERRIRHADGYWLSVLATVTLVQNERGEPHLFISQNLDEMLRRRAELQWARRLEALSAITDATLAEAGDVDSILRALAERVAAALGLYMATVRLLDPDDGLLHVRAYHRADGVAWSAPPVPPGVGPGGAAAVGETVNVRDVRAEVGPATFGRVPAMTRSLVAVPLRVRGRFIGVLNAHADEIREFAEEDVRLLEVAADRAALLIEQARLYEAERAARRAAEEAADRTARMQAVAAALSDALTAEAVVDVVVDQAITALGGGAGAVSLLSEDGTALEMMSVRGFPDAWREFWQRMSLDVPLPMTEVVRSGEPLYFRSREERLARFPALDTAPSLSGEANALLPLAIEGRTYGAMLLGFAEERAFTADEQSFMLALARQCAQALERVRLQQRAAAAAAAVAADRLKTDLINTVSHELRTPLGVIKGYTTAILDYFDRLSREELRDFLREIDEAANRQKELVENLLQMARLEAGLEVEWEEVAPAEVVMAAVADARRRYPDRTITVDVSAGLPVVKGDARRLREVLANLLDNAVKYSPFGGPVDVRVEPAPGGGVTISVQDRGIGIAQEHQARVFDRFYRVSAGPAREIGGTGLGLAICQRIIEAHGGSIAVESEEGTGSTFTVRLPRRSIEPAG